jgi:hypothetical protein
MTRKVENMAAKDTYSGISIKALDAGSIKVPIIGTAPLIVNNWSEKARKQMLDNMQGKKSPKEVKDPQAEYLASLYRIYKEAPARSRTTAKPKLVEAYGFPVIAFKAATVSAARFFDKSISMTALRQYLFFKGILTKADSQELVEINGEPDLREDAVKVGVSGHDLRYRGQFWPWSAVLTVTYIKNSIDEDSVLSLIDAGGIGVGVGEWRPERKGAFGTYNIDLSKKIVQV